MFLFYICFTFADVFFFFVFSNVFVSFRTFSCVFERFGTFSEVEMPELFLDSVNFYKTSKNVRKRTKTLKNAKKRIKTWFKTSENVQKR